MKSIRYRLIQFVSMILVYQTSLFVQANIIISEYIEGSSYNKVIELYNTSTNDIDLSLYQIQYYFNGNTSPGRTINLSGIINAQGVYVIAHSRADFSVTSIANQLDNGSWFNGDDAVALVNAGNIVDVIGQIGLDPGSSWNTGGVSTKDMTLIRQGTIIQGDTNGNDTFSPSDEWIGFAQDTFSGLGSHEGGSGGEPLVCADPATRIHTIQGNSSSSPLIGQLVEVEGIVTASFQQIGQLNGFYLQEENSDQDTDVQTSEGIFIATSSALVNIGDQVRVQGSVGENFGSTQINNILNVVHCGVGSVSPTTVVMPVTAIDDLEAYEGMLIDIAQALFVTDTYNLARFGEVEVATERLMTPTQVVNPGAEATAYQANNDLKRLIIDDFSGVQNPEIIIYPAPELTANNSLRLGDFAKGLVGVLDYSFGRYRVQPTVIPNFITNNVRTSAPELIAGGNIKVASFNVLNFFNGDGQGSGFPTSRGADTQEELIRQKDKIIAAIHALDADIVGLIEIENDGFSNNSAIRELIDGINASLAMEQHYQFVDLGVSNVGTDAITTALIYRTSVVSEIGQASFTTSNAFSNKNRPPVMQSFQHQSSQAVINVVVNHFKSKGSCSSASGNDQDLGDGQGCWNQTRVNAANDLVSWINSNPTGVSSTKTIILGDLNAYAKEDPIRTLEQLGYLRVEDIIQHSGLDYSYSFGGQLGSLDHILLSPGLKNELVDWNTWWINADEPRALDYNVEFKSSTQLNSLYAPDAYRASDHDPVVISINL